MPIAYFNFVCFRIKWKTEKEHKIINSWHTDLHYPKWPEQGTQLLPRTRQDAKFDQFERKLRLKRRLVGERHTYTQHLDEGRDVTVLNKKYTKLNQV